jgi:general secretion pathway protein G
MLSKIRRHQRQGGFTLVELLVVITILGVLAAIVLFNISGVNAKGACNAMKTDGATIQAAADLYFNNTGNYPDTVADKPVPLAGEGVNINELKAASLLHQSPPATEAFTYNGGTPNGTVHGAMVPNNPACVYN